MPRQDPPIAGILNIDKPYGISSMDVVRRIKRASGIRRVGHGGTLDPIATGVIPICIGQATRVMEYLVDGSKEYRAEVELGVNTDTYDAHGQSTARGDTSGITEAAIFGAMEGFKGVIEQVPPMFSALKKDGKRLYDLARAGIEVEREPRRVEVHSAELVEWSPPNVTLEVKCGRGFYMRSLAHDLGQVLGCGGHLKSLVRLRTGPFNIEEALSLPEAEQRFDDGTWKESFHSPDVVLGGMRALIVSKRSEIMIRDGRPLASGPRTPPVRSGEQCRVYTTDGRFVAIASFDATLQHWRPTKVFSFSQVEPEVAGSPVR